MMKIINRIFVLVALIVNCSYAFARMNWSELSNEQQKILLPFEPSWNNLDDNAREKLIVNTNKWLDMTPEQRSESKQKLNRFKQLPKEERERVKQRFNHYKNLNPQERKELERAKRRFQQLNPEQKKKLRNKYNQLPPQQRKDAVKRFNRKLNEKEFISKFDIEKRRPIVEMFKSLEKADRLKFRNSMKSLSPKQRHQHILKLLDIDAEDRGVYIQALKVF